MINMTGREDIADRSNILLTSFVVKKISGKHNILLFSTTHDEISTSKDERMKPNTICFYDKTKGGVDVVNITIGKYTRKLRNFFKCQKINSKKILPNKRPATAVAVMFALPTSEDKRIIKR